MAVADPRHAHARAGRFGSAVPQSYRYALMTERCLAARAFAFTLLVRTCCEAAAHINMYSWCQHDRRLPGPGHVNPCAVLERPHSGKLRHRARASAMVGTLLPMDCVEIKEGESRIFS